jgi:hypothetical protein
MPFSNFNIDNIDDTDDEADWPAALGGLQMCPVAYRCQPTG